MKLNVGLKLAVGFGLALAVFTAVGILSYHSTQKLIDAAEIRKHTYEVITDLAETGKALVDIETGQRGFILTGDDAYLEPYTEGTNTLVKSLQQLRKLTADNPKQQRLLDKLEDQIKNRLKSTEDGLEARRSGGLEAALAHVKTGRGKAAMDEVRKVIDDMRTEEERLLQQRAADSEKTAEQTKLTILVGTLLALFIGGVSGLLITRNISGPLQELTKVAQRITSGDLSVNVRVNERSDEVGTLALAFDQMAHSLRGMAGVAEQIAAGDLRAAAKPKSAEDQLGNSFARMSENLRQQIAAISESTQVLASAAAEIVVSTTQLASSASESAAAVSQTTTTVEEVRQTAQLSNQKAKVVADTAQKTAQFSQAGRRATDDVTAGMGRIRHQMEAIGASMMRLSEQSQAIGLIIATVEDLAAQSNLLAVNAAIEAAKAGEHGKGFGVVAQEIKALAEQSRQATNQVRTLLGDIQKATTAAVMATEQGSKAVEAGERQSVAAGDSILSLSGSVTEAAQVATQIAASSQQQLVGVDQVAGAMESIKQATTQNVASARQLESSARNLNELGARFKQLIERYKV